jgi:hypothetical protein
MIDRAPKKAADTSSASGVLRAWRASTIAAPDPTSPGQYRGQTTFTQEHDHGRSDQWEGMHRWLYPCAYKAGGVLGKQVDLITEDDQTTNPGAVLAFSKLAAQSDIVAFVGPIRSTQVHAMAPDLLKVAKPMMFGGTDPALTKPGNRWLFRFRPNDSYSGRVIATYGVETLGKKRWAVVHSTDAFGTNGGKALTESLSKIGGTLAIDQGDPNQSPDFTPVVLAIKQSGADIIGSYLTFENDLAIFALQLRQLGVTIPWGRLAHDRCCYGGQARRAASFVRRRSKPCA